MEHLFPVDRHQHRLRRGDIWREYLHRPATCFSREVWKDEVFPWLCGILYLFSDIQDRQQYKPRIWRIWLRLDYAWDNFFSALRQAIRSQTPQRWPEKNTLGVHWEKNFVVSVSLWDILTNYFCQSRYALIKGSNPPSSTLSTLPIS